MVAPSKYAVDFPTLWVVPAWIERHCVIPDGFRKGRPFRMYDWQLWCTANHYRVKEDAVQDPGFLAGDPDAIPVRSAAFLFRRSQVIAPQKTGKGPWSASIICAEALGPVLFLDWAVGGEQYVCADYGCGCGWVYTYEPGEPMGHGWATRLIQLLATSEDQVDNVYRPLKTMARGPKLRDQLKVREGFIRVVGDSDDPEEDRIDVVTSSAMSRLGNPINFCLQDESQLYTSTNRVLNAAETMRRGVAAMGGRSIETTNCPDPAQDSTAQRTFESAAQDVFRFYEPPPKQWSYKNKAERRKIHAYNYAGSPHVDLNGIDAEAAELAEKDPNQAERFYGNRFVYSGGTWLNGDTWDDRKDPEFVPLGALVVLGFDGSDVDDWTGIRAETADGYQFTPVYGPDERPTAWNPAEWGGQVPRSEVSTAVAELFSRYTVIRMYCDPPDWKSEIDDWAEQHGEAVVRWETYRPTQMHAATQRLYVDVTKQDTSLTHDGCPTTAAHVRNARKHARPSQRYVLGKASQTQKIDLAVCSVLAHEAAGDATSAGLFTVTDSMIYTSSSTRIGGQRAGTR